MAIIRNEGYFVSEWLWFHRLVGVEKFYIALHDTEDDTIEKMERLPFRDDIHLLRLSGRGTYYWGAHRLMFLEQYKEEIEWMIICDADEFFFNPQKIDLKTVLQEFDDIDCGGVVVPWTVFGLNGYIDRPPLPITDHLVRCSHHLVSIKGILKTSMFDGTGEGHLGHLMKTTVPYLLQDKTPYHGKGDTVLERRDHKIKCHHYQVRGMLDIIRRAKQAAENRWYNIEDEQYPYDIWASIACEPWRNVLDTSATLYSKELKELLEGYR